MLERIRRQDAGEIEPPAIAIGGFRGASSEGNMDDDEDDDVEIEDDLEVRGETRLQFHLCTSSVCMLCKMWLIMCTS